MYQSLRLGPRLTYPPLPPSILFFFEGKGVRWCSRYEWPSKVSFERGTRAGIQWEISIENISLLVPTYRIVKYGSVETAGNQNWVSQASGKNGGVWNMVWTMEGLIGSSPKNRGNPRGQKDTVCLFFFFFFWNLGVFFSFCLWDHDKLYEYFYNCLKMIACSLVFLSHDIMWSFLNYIFILWNW